MLRTSFDVIWACCFSPDAVIVSADKVKSLPVVMLEDRALYVAVTLCALGLPLLWVCSSAKRVMWWVWYVCFGSQNHRTGEVGRDLWRSSVLAPLLREDHPELVAQDRAGFWASPRMEPPWAACASAQSPWSERSISWCSAPTLCVSVCAHGPSRYSSWGSY